MQGEQAAQAALADSQLSDSFAGYWDWGASKQSDARRALLRVCGSQQVLHDIAMDTLAHRSASVIAQVQSNTAEWLANRHHTMKAAVMSALRRPVMSSPKRAPLDVIDVNTGHVRPLAAPDGFL